MFRALIQNDQAMTVVITIVLINCAVYTTSNLVIYFFKYDLAARAGTTATPCLIRSAERYRFCP